MSATPVRQVEFVARERAELREVDWDPAPLAAGEIEGETLFTLISAGTELAGRYLGEQFPKRPGYAAVIRVSAVGAAVSDLTPGDLAYVSGPHRSRQRARREQAVPIPSGLAPQRAVFCRLIGVSMTTLQTTRARPPDRVMVTGLGLVGHLAAAVFRRAGYRVLGVDPDPSRRELAETHARIEEVRDRSPVGEASYQDIVALALECSGHEQAALDACRIVRRRGEVALVGCPWVRRTDLHAHEILSLIFHRYVDLRSGWEWELPLQAEDFRPHSIYGNYAAAMEWLREGAIDVDPLCEVAEPSRAQECYQELLHGRCSRLSFLLDWTA
jgi:threonine dehydrogenase-like Zn-dependent dehydrogenase